MHTLQYLQKILGLSFLKSKDQQKEFVKHIWANRLNAVS